MASDVHSSDLVIRGARTHNLKNVDLTLPAGQLIVFTGVSGSGKSSLAFDTIYAEGQRRYVESLSAYARQFLERMEKPDVDRIDGICPSIAIRQKNSVRNPRSTVGTVTEIHDYMRLLYARVGRTICRTCGQEVIRETAEVVTNRLLALPEGARLMLGFDLPIVATAKAAAAEDGEEADERADESLFEVESPSAVALDNLRRKGFGRLLINGQAVAFEDVDAAALKAMPVLRVVVDRVKVAAEARTRITDSVETSYAEGGGAAWAIQLPDASTSDDAGTGQSAEPITHQFSERFECRTCGIPYEDPQPRLFSFNNPFGACPTCHGFGNIIELDQDLVVPDASKSINQGAIEPWTKPHYRAQLAELKRAARANGIRLDVPWSDLTPKEIAFVMDGDPSTRDGGGAARSGQAAYEGVRGF
ncbi:MAG TPA: hypothetical protein VFV51_13385, partial [Vicinamibacterales bacterium]|nr:hypothetical protein [Vicinamibacterales bacterium]